MYMPESGRYQLAITGTSSYDGLPGIGVFAAALWRVTREDKWRELANSSFKFVRELLKKEADQGIRSIGIGGAAGFGSILYTMTRAGMLLDDSSLIDDALTALKDLTPKHIEEDKVYDVIGGSAGAILSLLAVYDLTADPLALEHAQGAARHLLKGRVQTDNGHRAWKTIMSRPLTGYSHGAAGVAFALLRLYRVTGDEDLRAAALEALAFEDAEYSPERENWRDLRDMVNGTLYDPEHPMYSAAWCHGAPGIGLARLGALGVHDDPQMRADIQASLDTTGRALEYLHVNPDHLCCGNVGRMELLWSAGEILNRPDLKTRAQESAARMVHNAQELGGYYFSSFTPRGVFSPGLFIGAAGIGYQLLRFGSKEKLPNVLLWE
jgi:type 2 lantibiotic biosynthesis protein LanM